MLQTIHPGEYLRKQAASNASDETKRKARLAFKALQERDEIDSAMQDLGKTDDLLAQWIAANENFMLYYGEFQEVMRS